MLLSQGLTWFLEPASFFFEPALFGANQAALCIFMLMQIALIQFALA